MSNSWHKQIGLVICTLICVMLLSGCRQAEYPKPYAYFRIDLPEATYSSVDFDKKLQFDLSDYAVLRNSDEESGNYDIWRNIEIGRAHV